MEVKLDLKNETILFINDTDRFRTIAIPFKAYCKSEIIDFEGVRFLIMNSFDTELCLCDSRASFKALLKSFVENTKKFDEKFAEYKDKYDYVHKLLATVLENAAEEYNLNIYSYSYEKFGLSTTSDYLKGFYVVEYVESLESVKDMCDSILPENLEKTKLEVTKSDIQKMILFYKNVLGENFELLSETDDVIFETLRVLGETTVDLIEKLEDDFANEKNAAEKNLVDVIWRTRFMDFFPRILEIAYKKLYFEEKDYLLRRYGDLQELKANVKKSIDKLSFTESLDLYREYQEAFKVISAEVRQRKTLGHDNNLWDEYKKFFLYGSVLVSDHMNKINKNKAKNKPISQDDLDGAMIFFYDASSAEDAYQKRKITAYKEDKAAGNVGEKNVNYALKWLDNDYIQIEPKSYDRVGEKCIIIKNDAFIDEAQEYDHIVLSHKGLFVIETKNLRGTIRIDANHNWSKEVDGEVNGITNPLQQVRRHEKVLKSFLPKELPIISIVCIANDNAIIEGIENSDIPIVKSDRLVEFLETYNNDTDVSDYLILESEKLIYSYMV